MSIFGQDSYRFPRTLDPWLTAVTEAQNPEVGDLAQSKGQDRAAVLAAVSLRWSNMQVEGQVNRLKLIKRQMYGRAKFDLLRARVLAGAGGRDLHEKCGRTTLIVSFIGRQWPHRSLAGL